MMKLENEIVLLEKESENIYSIFHNEKVGEIRISDFGLYFAIDPEFQGNHYASNAVYLFTKYLHDNENLEKISALIPNDNEMARHIVEHSGYHIASRNEDAILYVHEKEVTRKDDSLKLEDNQRCLYLAGGCFWGTEKVFKVLDGVLSTCVGYANGTIEDPNYEDIIRNETGFKETVRVIYDTEKVSTETVLKAYFMVIDPTLRNQQADDYGSQYQTGVYYRDVSLLPEIEKVFAEEKEKYDEFYVELKPLECFYEAEEYHQDYLDKNPQGYCHISRIDLDKVKKLNEQK